MLSVAAKKAPNALEIRRTGSDVGYKYIRLFDHFIHNLFPLLYPEVDGNAFLISVFKLPWKIDIQRFLSGPKHDNGALVISRCQVIGRSRMDNGAHSIAK